MAHFTNSVGACFWLVLVQVMAAVHGQAPCLLNQVPVQDNFNLTQFMGQWYEITWIAPKYHEPDTQWINYYHVYTQGNFGVVSSYYSGKDPANGKCFLSGQILLPTKEHPAKLQIYSVAQKGIQDYWVMKTDYINYAMVYACINKSTDYTTCIVAGSWLWGRTKTLPDSVKTDAENLWAAQCMNITLLYTTRFIGDDCVPDKADCPTGGSKQISSASYLVAVAFALQILRQTAPLF